MEFDERQKKAIECDGKDMLVSASAGCGKTTVMIERILRLIKSGVKLDRMMIVTFTKAAAADMKTKLFKALVKESGDRCCREALQALPTADISTLHSFCGKLARTYFYAIDVDPAFEVLGEKDGALLGQCIDALCDDLPEGCDRLYEILLTKRKDKKFRTAVKRLYLAAYSMPEPSRWLENCLSKADDDSEAKDIIEKFYHSRREKLLTLARDCRLRSMQAGFKRNEKALEELVGVLESGDGEFTVRPYGRVEPLFDDLNEEFKTLKDLVKKMFEARSESLAAKESALAKTSGEALVKCVARLAEIYEKEKRKRGVCDYNDLEHYAYGILSSEVGEAVRNRYDRIFVDEYQDINPLQDAIIELLKQGGDLFMVGDLKQSIYAFRGCDPAIFAAKRERFARGEGTSVELNLNFRTLPKVIDGVNKVFSEVMTPAFGGVDYVGQARMEPVRKGEGLFRYVNIVTEKNRGERARGVYRVREHTNEYRESAADAESEFIANEILELLSGAGEDGRPVEPRDIAVLTRSRSEMTELLREKLKAAGVSVTLGGEEDRALAKETAPLVAMLRLIDNNTDDIALASVLASYLVGLTNDELAGIAETMEKDETFCRAARRCERLGGFFERLDRYTVMSGALSVGELLAKISVDSDAFVKVRKMSGGEEKSRALSAFLASAEGYTSVREFIDNTAAAEDDNAQGENSVKIMTVHMSKGLEFEYVFLGGVSHEFNRSDFSAPYLIDRRFGLAFKYADEETRKLCPTLLTQAAKIATFERFLEEELRILYVAMTRAKRGLTVSGTNISRGSIKDKYRLPCCQADFLYMLAPETVKAECGEKAERVESVKRTLSNGDKALAEKLAMLMDAPYPHKQVKAKTSVTAALKESEEDEGYYAGEAAEYASGEDATARGSAYHLFLQKLDFHGDFDESVKEFEKLFPEEAALVDFSRAEAAAKRVASVIGDAKVYKEKEFIFDDGGTLVQGVIDLMAVSGNEAVIVDYKTGKNTAKPAYKKQLELYAEAAEKIQRLKVVKKYICAIDEGRIFEV